MSCTDLNVSPNVFEMGSLETLPLTFDATPILLEGETITSATASLVQVDTGVDYDAGLVGPVIVDGSELSQTVTALSARKRYRLSIQFEIAPNKIWAPYLLIECPA